MANVDRLKALIEPLVTDLGYEFVGLEYLSNPKNRVIRVFIDRPQVGVSLDDCGQVSAEVSALLDLEDPVPGHYTLEISSPGVERPLFTPAQFQRHAGERAQVHLHGTLAGKRKLEGIIVGADQTTLVLEADGARQAIGMDAIRKAHLKPDLNALLPRSERLGKRA